MGYYATYEGELTFRNGLSLDETDYIRNYFENFPYESDFVSITDGHAPSFVRFEGYDKFDDESWIIMFSDLFPFIDMGVVNEVCFNGDDDRHWLYSITQDGICEVNGRVVYDECIRTIEYKRESSQEENDVSVEVKISQEDIL